jgi:hypothetical protein
MHLERAHGKMWATPKKKPTNCSSEPRLDDSPAEKTISQKKQRTNNFRFLSSWTPCLANKAANSSSDRISWKRVCLSLSDSWSTISAWAVIFSPYLVLDKRGKIALFC